MAFQLEDINFKTVADPKGFIEEGDQAYKDRVAKAADKIISNRDKSPIVLLSGPSGSSKTTTSMKIAEDSTAAASARTTSAWTIISRPSTRTAPVHPRAIWILNPRSASTWSL